MTATVDYIVVHFTPSLNTLPHEMSNVNSVTAIAVGNEYLFITHLSTTAVVPILRPTGGFFRSPGWILGTALAVFYVFVHWIVLSLSVVFGVSGVYD